MYNTTNSAVVDVGDREAQDWKVHSETAPEIKNAPSDDRRRSYCQSYNRSDKYPQRKRSSVLGELEANEAIDEETPTSGSGEATLYSHKVWIHNGREWDDTRVEDEGDDGERHVKVEKSYDFLATDGGVLGSDVKDHDCCHDQSSNMDEVGCY